MDPFRYPIGLFEPIKVLTSELRNEVITRIETLAPSLIVTVQSLSDEQLDTPYRPEGWTVRQVIHHMADNDMNAFLRFKRALTEENVTASSYREDLFAELCDYKLPVEASLLLLESLHRRFVSLLRSLSSSDYQLTFTTPALGLIHLDTAVQRFDWHNRHHMAQITSLKARSGW